VDVLEVLRAKTEKSYLTRAYNGVFPGPVMRLDPGDDVRVWIVNNLEDSWNHAGTNNSYHGLNTTNVHTHGLHIGPTQDNVLEKVPPGETKAWHYTIREDHLPGVHWCASTITHDADLLPAVQVPRPQARRRRRPGLRRPRRNFGD